MGIWIYRFSSNGFCRYDNNSRYGNDESSCTPLAYIHGDWSMVDIDSDLEAELLIYDEMLNTVDRRVICEVCLRQDNMLYKKYYGDMIGEINNNSDDDEDHYIIELE